MRTRNKVIDFTKVESVKRSSKRFQTKEKENSDAKNIKSTALSDSPKLLQREKQSTSAFKSASSKYANSKTKVDLAKTTFSITICDNDSENESCGFDEDLTNIKEVKIKVEKLIDEPSPISCPKICGVIIDNSSIETEAETLPHLHETPEKSTKDSKGVLTSSNKKHEEDFNFNKFDINHCPVLKEVYDELDHINQGPSLLLKDNSKTVEHVWNDLIDGDAVNESMRKQESFLSSVSLLRIGVENAWLQKREQRSEALSRRALGRLRPNPKRSNYADMVPSGRRRKFKKESEPVLKPVARRPGRPRLNDSTNQQSRKESLLGRPPNKAFNSCRKRAVRIARRARQQRNKPSSTTASVSDSDSMSNRTETRSSTLKLRPQRYLTGLRSGDVSSYISKRFCYGNDKGQGKVNSDYLHKRKRKCTEFKPQKEKLLKKTKSDISSDSIRVSVKRKSAANSASTSVSSTPVKETVKLQIQPPIPKPKLIQPPKHLKASVQENVTKLFEQRELHKLHKMQQRIEKESMRRENAIHGKITDWPPKDRALSILDRLILGLECELIRGNDPKGVELRGLSKPDFDKLRERIRKSGYFFGYIQYYPEEENPNGRDEYDCCITSDENRRNMRGSSRSNNSESNSSMVPDPKKQFMRKLQSGSHTAASTAAIKLSKRARHSYPQNAGAAKRKYNTSDDTEDIVDDMNRGNRESFSDIELTLNEPPHKLKPSYQSGSESETGSVDDMLSGSPVVKKLGPRPNSLIEEEIPMHRRHSPKKVIRKVYTGSSSQPKILSKKRTIPLSGNTVISASSSLLTTTRIPEPPIHSVSSSNKIFSAASSSYRTSQTSTVAMRSSAVVTSSVPSVPITSHKSLIRRESQEFWRLKGVEQNQIMDKHILTPATAMTASEIMRLKRFEAETVRHPNDFALPVNQNAGRTVNKVFHSTNTVDTSSVVEPMQPPKLEIDGEETDDDFEFQIQLPSATNILSNSQSLKLLSKDAQSASEIPRLPLSSAAALELNANNSNEDTASEDSPHKNSKRRIIHQFHTFRKILPKSANLSSKQNVPANIAQPQTSQRPQFPLITSPQGRPMVPPVTAYANNPVNKSLISKSESSGKSASKSTGKDSNIHDVEESVSKSEISSDINKGQTQLLKSLLESGRAPSPSVALQSSSSSPGLANQQMGPTVNQSGNKQGLYLPNMPDSRGTWQVNKPRVSLLPSSGVGGLPGILPSQNSFIKSKSMVGLPSENKIPLSGVKLRVSSSTSGPVAGQSSSVLKITKSDTFSNSLTQRAAPIASKADISNPKLVPRNQPSR